MSGSNYGAAVRSMLGNKYIWLAVAFLISLVVIWVVASPLYALAAYTVFGLIFLLLKIPKGQGRASRLPVDDHVYITWHRPR